MVLRTFFSGLLLAAVACSSPDPDAETTESAVADDPEDSVLYLGVNSISRAHEIAGLGGQAPIVSIAGEPRNGTARLGASGAVVDLSAEEGIEAFLASMPKLDRSGREAVRAVLALTRAVEAKDEMAQLVRALYDVENGAPRIRRIVFSGHSEGFSIRGEKEGDALFDFRPLPRLTSAFPKATRGVAHVAISGCNTARNHLTGEWLFANYVAAFPEVETIWAYKGNSPTIPHSTEHLKLWESASRRSDAAARLDLARVAAMKFGNANGRNVRVWTATRTLGE